MSKWDIMACVVSQWQTETFPKASISSVLAHLREEIDEVESTPDDLAEWADVMMLLMGGLATQGFSMTDLFVAVGHKLAINQARDWGKPDVAGVVHHTKGESE